jgi:hypothetical protein
MEFRRVIGFLPQTTRVNLILDCVCYQAWCGSNVLVSKVDKVQLAHQHVELGQTDLLFDVDMDGDLHYARLALRTQLSPLLCEAPNDVSLKHRNRSWRVLWIASLCYFLLGRKDQMIGQPLAGDIEVRYLLAIVWESEM